MGFEVLAAMVMKSTIFMNIPLKTNRRFGGIYIISSSRSNNTPNKRSA
jgi:hypothetical protein